MRAFLQPRRPALPGPLFAALALAMGFLAFVAWDQSHWWRVKEDYTFGWLVPAFAGFVIFDRRRRIVAAAQACRVPGSVRVHGIVNGILGGFVAASLTLGVLLFLLGAFYRAGAGTSQPGTLAITLGAIGIVLPLIFLNAPEPEIPDATNRDAGCGSATDGSPLFRAENRPEHRKNACAAPSALGLDPEAAGRAAGLCGDARLRLTALFLFPVLVWLVSAPLVSAVESQLSLFLLRKVVTVVSAVFDLLGLPIEQQGNVLLLPMGKVGVEQACSGIRSLTACLFAGSLLAALLLDRLWQKILLVVAALGLALVTNLARGLVLTGLAYQRGPEAIGGAVHDVAGYSVLGLTVLGLLGLLTLLKWTARAPGKLA